jgi:hypothetical protein
VTAKTQLKSRYGTLIVDLLKIVKKGATATWSFSMVLSSLTKAPLNELYGCVPIKNPDKNECTSLRISAGSSSSNEDRPGVAGGAIQAVLSGNPWRASKYF